MVVGRAVTRCREGKTVAVELSASNCRILQAIISGDFFAYPETVVEELEKLLTMCSSRECIREAVEKALSRGELLGASAECLVEAIARAFESVCRSEV